MRRAFLSGCLTLAILLPSAATIPQRLEPDSELTKQGRAWKKQLEKDQRAVDAALDRLDRAIALFTDQPGVGDAATLVELKEFVGVLRRLAPKVATAHEQAADATRSFERSLQAAAPIFAESATLFRDYASGESFDDLRREYEMWAEFFDELSKRYLGQGETAASTVQALTWNQEYVSHTGVLLERIDSHLNVPSLDDPDTEKFLRRLSLYVSGFNDLRKRVQTLRSRIGACD